LSITPVGKKSYFIPAYTDIPQSGQKEQKNNFLYGNPALMRIFAMLILVERFELIATT
jgi:hypothetical protein